MIEAMWVWGALGLILLAIEMATGTFYAHLLLHGYFLNFLMPCNSRFLLCYL